MPVPLYALPKKKKFKTETANGLTSYIIQDCKEKGHLAIRTGNEGKFRPGTTVVNVIGQKVSTPGKWLPSDNPGLADIHICAGGKFIAIEVKIGKDRQSDVQKAYQHKVESAGGRYYIVKTVEEYKLLNL